MKESNLMAPRRDEPLSSQETTLILRTLRKPLSAKVVFLIPAHNEEQSIKQTVLSALNQSVCKLSGVTIDIVVIADNCVDNDDITNVV